MQRKLRLPEAWGYKNLNSGASITIAYKDGRNNRSTRYAHPQDTAPGSRFRNQTDRHTRVHRCFQCSLKCSSGKRIQQDTLGKRRPTSCHSLAGSTRPDTPSARSIEADSRTHYYTSGEQRKLAPRSGKRSRGGTACKRGRHYDRR